MTKLAEAEEQPFYDPTGFARLAEAEDWFFWFTARNRLICWVLKKYYPDMRSFCEIGYGTGATLQAVSRCYRQTKLIGVDFYEEGKPWAKKRVPKGKLMRGDIRNLQALGLNCDVVGAFDVLEHIPEDTAALTQLYQALRPGGGLILTVPQHPSLWSVSDEVGHHQRRYTQKELESKVRQAGFEVSFVTSFVSLLLPLLWLSRKRAHVPEDAYAEFKINRPLNQLLCLVMAVERLLIKIGIRFPAGGSLLLLAHRT